jgi:GTPase SAR1 family protein
MRPHLEQQLTELRRMAARLSQRDKQQYLLGLTEDQFRDKVVRPIFRYMGYSDGRDTCGPDEMGRDAIFTQSSELSGVEITVVQTKRGNITKTSKASDNLDNIAAQLRTAIQTPVKLLSKVKKQPIRGYLVASGEIKSAARDYIVDEIPDGRLYFLDAPHLIPLIDQHMPELWLNIDSELLPYFRAVATRLEQDADLYPGTLNPLGLRHSVTTDIYFANINVYRARRPPALNEKHRKKTSLPHLDSTPVTEVITRPESLILLVGGSGAGKTTALQRILYESATRPIHAKGVLNIPVYVRARDIALNPSLSLIDHALTAVKRLGPDLKQPFTDDDLREGRVTILVDGLDEVPDREASDKIIALILSFNSSYSKSKVILTSRKTKITEDEAILAKFTSFHLAPLSANQISKLVSAYTQHSSLAPEDSTNLIKTLEEIHGVELNPLIVTVFLATSSSTRSDAPANITQLFDKYTRLVLGQWDESKGLDQQILAPLKHYVVGQVALRMHEGRRSSVSLEQFRQWILDELQSRGYQEQSADLYSEIIERSGLFKIEDDKIEFKHQILQEYFTGISIPNSAHTFREADDPWWTNSIVFYYGTNPGSVNELRTLAENLENTADSVPLAAVSALGLSLQACYIAHLDDKCAIYMQLLSLLVEARIAPRELRSLMLDTPMLLVTTLVLFLREASALSALRLFADDIFQGIETRYSDDSERRNYAVFWFIVGLLESGHFELAKQYLERSKLKGTPEWFGVFLDSAVLASTRIISEPNRKALSGFVATARELGKGALSAARRTWTAEVNLLESDGRMVAGQLPAEPIEEKPGNES